MASITTLVTSQARNQAASDRISALVVPKLRTSWAGVPVGLARHPYTGFQCSLADVQRGHPLQMQRLVVDFFHYPPRFRLDERTAWPAGEPRAERKSGPRARSDKERPSQKPAPSVRLRHGLIDGAKELRRHSRPPAHSIRHWPEERSENTPVESGGAGVRGRAPLGT